MQFVTKGENNEIVPTDIVGVSTPRPEIKLADIAVSNVAINKNAGTATVTLNCDEILDPVADNLPENIGEIEDVTITVDGDEGQQRTVAVVHNPNGRPAPSFWKQHPYKSKFSKDVTVTIPLEEGTHSIKAETGENAAGLTGFDEVSVTLDKEVVTTPPTPPTYIHYNIAFPKNTKIKEDIAALEAQKAKLEEQLAQLEADKTAKETLLANKQAEYKLIKEQIGALSKQIRATSRERSGLKRDLGGKKNELTKIKKKKPFDHEKYDAVLAEVNNLKTQLAAKETEQADLRTAYKQKRKDRTTVSREISAIKSDIRKIKRDIARIKRKTTRVDKRMKSLKKQLAKPDTSKVVYYLGDRAPLATDPVFNERGKKSFVYDGQYLGHAATITLTKPVKLTKEIDSFTGTYPILFNNQIVYESAIFAETGATTNIFRHTVTIPGSPGHEETTWKVARVANNVGSGKGGYTPILGRVVGLQYNDSTKDDYTIKFNNTVFNLMRVGGYDYIKSNENDLAIACVANQGPSCRRGASGGCVLIQEKDNSMVKTAFNPAAGIRQYLGVNGIYSTLKKLLTPKVELTRIPREIAAETTWDEIADELQKSIISVACEPKELLDDITLEIKEIKGGGGYAPGAGTLMKYPTDNTKWIYKAFPEPKTEKHPKTKDVLIVAKFNNKEVSLPVRLRVKTVFQFLTIGYTIDTGEIHKPTDADYNLAWRYSKWKYDINTDGLHSISYDKGQTDAGSTGTYTNNCTLGPTAFATENICASTLGHENVHGLQEALYIIEQVLSWNTGGKNQAEVQAYEWELSHAEDTGISQTYIDITEALRKKYNREQ